jgi:probable HAF family extracellular repeat protein
VGMAFAINDSGQAVGATGTCANTVLPGFAVAPHAVWWEPDGTVHLLPNLGGTAPKTSILGAGNVAESINRHGIIAGQSTLSNNTVWHPVLWQDGIISDLGVLTGDLVGAALDINDRGDVVGASISAPGPSSGNPRAWFWHDGVMTDLNTIVPSDSPLYLLTAFSINDAGEITGFGATEGGDLHGFLATPCRQDCSAGSSGQARHPENAMNLSEKARHVLLLSGFRGH